jgi:hypothetical protein
MDTCGTERTSRKGLPTGMKLQNLKWKKGMNKILGEW